MNTLRRSTDANTKVLLTNQLGVYSDDTTCPHCSWKVCFRVKRHGWQDVMWRLNRRFPWHCKQCGHRFYRFWRH
jgi:hypothetical protein